MKRARTIKAWIGVIDGKIPHYFNDMSYYDGVLHGDIYKTKKDAHKCYERVVQVLIKELPSKKGAKQ